MCKLYRKFSRTSVWTNRLFEKSIYLFISQNKSVPKYTQCRHSTTNFVDVIRSKIFRGNIEPTIRKKFCAVSPVKFKLIYKLMTSNKTWIKEIMSTLIELLFNTMTFFSESIEFIYYLYREGGNEKKKKRKGNALPKSNKQQNKFFFSI